MNVSIYAIFDTKAQCFWVPFILPNDATAIRQFTDIACSDDTEIARHPLDFELYRLGVINRQDGRVDMDAEQLLTGLQAVHHQQAEAQQLRQIIGDDTNA